MRLDDLTETLRLWELHIAYLERKGIRPDDVLRIKGDVVRLRGMIADLSFGFDGNVL